MKKVSAHILPNMHDEDYDALMGRYYSPIMKVCYMVAVGGGLDVNDVYQEVAMEIWTHFDTIMSRFRHEAAEETYVISIAINTALDYRSSVERRVRLVPITEQQCASVWTTPTATVSKNSTPLSAASTPTTAVWSISSSKATATLR